MLDSLFVVALLLCLIGVLIAVTLLLAKAHRATPIRPPEYHPASEPKLGAESSVRRVELASVPQEPMATIRVVPIDSSRSLGARKSAAAAKAGRTRKPSRRQAISSTDHGLRGEDRPGLLIKHARKRRRRDGPRVV